ncbi:MAG: ABC transporter ATP-binding protein [Planctomycetota bacterium]
MLFTLPHLHLLIPAVFATAIYTGVITLRALSAYGCLRLVTTMETEKASPTPSEDGSAPDPNAGDDAGQDPPDESGGDEESPDGAEKGDEPEDSGAISRDLIPEQAKQVITKLTDNDESWSRGLGWVNRQLDFVDKKMQGLIRGFVPDAVAADPMRMSQLASLTSLIFLFLVMTLIAAASHLTEHILKQMTLLRVVVALRVKLLKNLLQQPLAFHNDSERGDLINRMGSDLGSAVSALNLMIADMSRQAFAVLWPVIGALFISPWAFLAVVTYLGLLMNSLRKQTKKVHQRARLRQERTSKVTESMVQLFSGVRIVKAFGLERQKIDQYTVRNKEFIHEAMNTEIIKAWTRVRIEFVTNILIVAALFILLWVVSRGGKGVSISGLALFATLMVAMWRPIRSLTRTFTQMGDSLAGTDRMFEYMDRKPELRDEPGATALERVNGDIHFDNVTFAYNGGRRVLDRIDLKIKPGEVCALVGPSGAGKTTLANLLPRFYDPGDGQVLLDGKDIRACTQESLRSHIAVVSQEPFLFHTSIRENIAYGKDGATEEEVVNAAKAAHIHDHIMSLEEGYDTNVGEAGAKLSGGQRQRLTIARAILRNARILILDEATSSLDTESERAIQDALQNLMKGRTTLVIAHRLSTVQHADKICVLNDGVIEHVGTHDELMALDSLYRRLYDMQFSNGGNGDSRSGSGSGSGDNSADD